MIKIDGLIVARSNHFLEMEKKHMSEDSLWRVEFFEMLATFQDSLATKLRVHATLWRAFIPQNKAFLNAYFRKYISGFIDRVICTILWTSAGNEM
jgi:hypothetical protein